MRYYKLKVHYLKSSYDDIIFAHILMMSLTDVIHAMQHCWEKCEEHKEDYI